MAVLGSDCCFNRTCLRCGAEDETINHTLFECLPALQCWELSDIPTPPGLFPCNSLFTNIDHLLWRATEQGVPKECMEIFPWLLWYIWKARNNKIFNGVDEAPRDTLQLAISEAQNWKVAQIIPVVEEELSMTDEGDRNIPHRREEETRLRCQVDASWTRDGEKVGLGLVIMEGEKRSAVGLKQLRSAPSALHAEADGLLWAMKMMMFHDYKSMLFQTDCLQLVKLIEGKEEWPSMAMVIEKIIITSRLFDCCLFSYLPKGKNTRADCLAKASRTHTEPIDCFCIEPPV